MGLFGNEASDYFGSEDYKNLDIGNLAYKGYGAYNPYSSGLSDAYGGVTQQFLSGKLTPEEQEMMNRNFGNFLKSSREGSYGMPLGAQADIEARAGGDLALQGLLAGQQKQQIGLNAAMPFMQFQAGENRAAYDTGLNENRYGQSFNLGVRDNMAGYDAAAKKASAESGLNLGGFLQDLGGAATEYGLESFFGGGGNKASPGTSPTFSSSIFKSSASPVMTNSGQKKYVNRQGVAIR